MFSLIVEIDCLSTRGLRSSSTMVPVPVPQPVQQLISAAVVSLLTNHSLHGARAILVHPQQSFFPPLFSRSWRLRGWRRRVGGGKAQFPASSLTRTSSRGCSSLPPPGGVALGQAGLRWAGGVGRRGIAFWGRDLLGRRGAFGGLSGSSGIRGFALNTIESKYWKWKGQAITQDNHTSLKTFSGKKKKRNLTVWAPKNKLEAPTSASAAISYFDFFPGFVLISSNRPSSSTILVPKLSACVEAIAQNRHSFIPFFM